MASLLCYLGLTGSFLVGFYLILYLSAIKSKKAINCKKPIRKKYLLSTMKSLLLLAPPGYTRVARVPSACLPLLKGQRQSPTM